MKLGFVSETGKKLDCCDMAFRAGYLKARQDSANAFNSNNGIKTKKKKRNR